MDAFSNVISAAHSGATGTNGLAHPSLEQLRAGNYAKGRVVLHGLRIAIETPAGQRRTGKSDGQPWSVICMAHYGEISGTKGADGDPLDVFIGPWPESERVWVVNRAKDDDSGFDEHKILLGFTDADSAILAYRNSYERGKAGDTSITPATVACTIEQLKWWIKNGDHTVPLTTHQLPYDGAALMNDVTWDSTASPVGITVPELMYALRRQDREEQLLLDSVCAADVIEGADGEAVLDAMVVKLNHLERKLAQMQVIMRAAGGDVKPVAMQVTPPFRQRGTTNVAGIIELSDGQTISIYFHNPDSTPNKLTPDDEMVSWKWMLNKKDVTIVVAPERGRDLNPREVARRIMRLAEANSGRFVAANARRAERMQGIQQAKADIESKQAQLHELNAEIDRLEPLVEAKRKAPPAALQKDDHAGASDAGILPPGWSEAEPGGMATNPDPRNGGIIDKGATTGRWFVVFEDDSIPKSDVEFPTRAGAIAALVTALAARDAAAATAAAMAWKSVDPTTEEGYAAARAGGDDALLWHQDRLDSFFGERLVAIRNALRELGWTDDGSRPMQSGPLKKGRYVLEPLVKHIGAGRNVVGINYRIAGVAGFFMSDDLSRSPAEMAEKINMGLPKDAGAPEPDDYEKFAERNRINGRSLEAEGFKLKDGIYSNGYATVSYVLTTRDSGLAPALEYTIKAPHIPTRESVKDDLSRSGQHTFMQIVDRAQKPEDEGPTMIEHLVEMVREATGGVAKIATSSYFTFDFNGESDILFTDELRAQVEAALGEKVKEVVLPGLELQASIVPESYSVPEPEAPSPPASEKVRMAVVAQWKRLIPTDAGGYIVGSIKRSGSLVVAVDGRLDRATYKAIIAEANQLGLSPAKMVVYCDLAPYTGAGIDVVLYADARLNLAATEQEADPLAEARAYLQSVIDGSIDLSSPDVADKLTDLYNAHNGDASFDDLFARAADAYQAFMVQAALSAMEGLKA